MITASSVFSSVPPLFANLAKVITGDIDCSHVCLKAHGTDGSPYAVYPQAVLYPKTTADIKHAISFAREYRIPLTVCGGLTAASGGALGEGISIDLTRYFSHIRHVNMMDNTITVDAGVRIDDLIEKLSSWGVEVPVLRRTFSNATIGGLVATKSASSSTFYAGTIREWIEGLTVVVDSGEEHHIRDGVTPSGRLLGIYQSVFPLLSEEGPILRASRREQSDDATGYSLWNTSIGPRQLLDQIVGSEGTLAIITSITLRVIPRKKHTLCFLVPVPSFDLLETYVAIAKHHHAESMFMFDAAFRQLADSFHPKKIDVGVPLAPYTLLLTLHGNDEAELSKNASLLLKAFPEHADLYAMDEKHAGELSSHAFLHSLFYDYSKGMYMVSTAGEGIIVPSHSYKECLAALDETIAKTGRLYTITGYAGSGHVALSCAFDTKSLSYETDLQEYADLVIRTVSEWKGGLSAVGGDGLERTSMLPLVYNEATRNVFKKLKEAWDPLHIFNPSKKLGITKDYLMRHAARTLA